MHIDVPCICITLRLYWVQPGCMVTQFCREVKKYEAAEKKNTLFTDNTPNITNENEKLNITLTMGNLKVVGKDELIE